MDAELTSTVRKFILDFSYKKRSVINALTLTALLKVYTAQQAPNSKDYFLNDFKF